VNKKKLLVLIGLMILVAAFLAACSASEQMTEDGKKIFVSSDDRYQVIAPADWDKDRNTIMNGAIIAATKDGESQSLIVFSEKKKKLPKVTLNIFNNNLLTKIKESTDEFQILNQEDIKLDGKPTIATKIKHLVKDKETISWVYVMDAGDEFLRINGFTYQPSDQENTKIIEEVIQSFKEIK
jgi:hypothetical protein